MNYNKFKEDMFAKSIIPQNSGYTFKCPSFSIDKSTSNPTTEMHENEVELRQRISLICDIIEEYDKQKNR